MKRWISFFLSMLILLVGFSSVTISAKAASYGASWQSWKMSSSDYEVMQGYGCRVMAYAKMLSETGLNGFGNPDDLYKWGVANKKFVGQITEKGIFGTMMMDYVNAMGGSAVKGGNYKLSNDRETECKKIMELINQGYSCFLHCKAHTVYIGREESLAQGTPVIMDGNGTMVTFKSYKKYSFTDVDYFSVSGATSGSSDSGTVGTTVTKNPIIFHNITHSNITETTALVKASVTADCTQLSAVGVEWGYLINGAEIPQTEFFWKTGTMLNYISVDFGKEKDRNGNIVHLQPGKTIYYRFYATKKDGARLYTAKHNFMTPCAHNYSKEMIIREASCSETGVVQYLCKKCGSSYEKEISALGHNYEVSVVEPTRNESGYTLHKCSKCGDCYKDNYTDKIVESSRNCIVFNTITASNVTSTTAFVKTTVTADCSQLSAVGMEWGYLVDGGEVPQTEFSWRTGTYLNFISVDFGREVDKLGNIPTLEPGRTVYYRFFAAGKDGSRVYSNTESFTTKNNTNNEDLGNTNKSEVNCITFEKIEVSDITSTTAFIKTTVTADCTQLSAVGMEWGYIVGTEKIPKTEFSWKTGTYLNFISVDFGKEKDKLGDVPTLEPSQMVYYRFFGVKKDGSRVYSGSGYFNTK